MGGGVGGGGAEQYVVGEFDELNRGVSGDAAVGEEAVQEG